MYEFCRCCEAIRCYQCSSYPKSEDTCGAYTKFDKSRHIAVECNSDESHTLGTFCMKITQQGPKGDGRWRQVIRRCASVADAGVTGVCNWGVYENGIYWEECYCSSDGCNGSTSVRTSLSALVGCLIAVTNRRDDLATEDEEAISKDEKGFSIITEEVELALKEMKNGKATGVDEIPIELMKCLGEEKKQILLLRNEIYEKGECPENFTETVLIPIPKKNNAKNCKEFRTISLISWKKQLEEEQFGIMKRKGMRDAIGLLQIIGKRYLEKNKEVYVIFVDLEKAFDRINANKTKTMVIGRKAKKVNFRILNEAVEQVDSFSWLFNDAVSTPRLFSVDEIGDSEMIFGEMRPRIRHRLPCIHITAGENLGKNPARPKDPTFKTACGGGGGGDDDDDDGTSASSPLWLRVVPCKRPCVRPPL
ncbi:hypothetical protein ANN_15734 [Periplaneta americana]|uniref:Protein sleepless n=1 Tax=Periplaneta americana TaxID=6978 RepID=A0ABQ8SH26_PERAM|nr:hypothetical protein ANN_15734 [Periplaneta americana]